jgi:GxxExxY protein
MNTDDKGYISGLGGDVGVSAAFDVTEFDGISEKAIGAGIQVSNDLGAGFAEKVYENAMIIRLRHAGLSVQQQVRFKVMYEGQCIGDYVADMVIDGKVLVELKAVETLDKAHVAQCLNYLRVSGLRVCLLFNFGRPRLQWKRLVH